MLFIIITGKHLRYTAWQRYHESTADNRQRILIEQKKKQPSIAEKEQLLATVDKRSVSVVGFKQYIKQRNDKAMNELNEFYRNMLWRKLNFRVHCYGNKSLDLFINRIGK